jgi:hypothetical protein
MAVPTTVSPHAADLRAQLIMPSEFYYQLSVDGLANGSDAFGG